MTSQKQLSPKEQLLNKLNPLLFAKIEAKQLQPSTENKEYYPLTSAQKRLYLLHEIDPQSLSYNLPVAFLIEGPLSIEQLKNAFCQVIARHEILRTHFQMQEGTLVQKVHPTVSFEIDHHISEDPLSVQFINFVKPFDLTIPCQMRVRVSKISPNKHLLLLDMHHIISDAMSMGVLLNEIVTFYEGRSSSPLSFQYKDYALWQQKNSTSSDIQSEKKYWLNRFQDLPQHLHLITDYPRTASIEQKGDQYFFTVGDKLARDLKNLGRENKATLYILLMAIYHVFLFKYTGQQDIVVGSSVEGRRLPELKALIGAFINILPLRSSPTASQTFLEFLGQVRSTCLDALQNQNYPFEELIEGLPIERELNRNPLFDTFFDFHTDREGLQNFGDLSFKPLQFSNKASKFDLSLEAISKGDHLEFYFEYNASLFSKETVERMAKHFEKIVIEVVMNPHILLDEISLLPEEEKKLLLFDLNQPENNHPPGFVSFCEIFKKQVAIRPHAVAALCEEEQITYSSLDEQSDHLASHLKLLGLKEGEIVAFLLPRGLHFLISMLAIFKAKCAYVPIDPAFPEERIMSLVEESGCIFILNNLNSISYKCPVLNVIDLLKTPAPSLEHRDLHPHDAAYIIFTSGSTGKPKGAVVEHHGMVNHLWTKVLDLELSENDCVAQTSSQTFDVSVWQFLVALMVGGKVVIFPHEKAWDPHLLLSTIEKENITIFETVPSHMNLIMQEIEYAKREYTLSSLRWMILNGEPFAKILWEKWKSHYPNIPMMNAYGPTECSDDVCHYKVTPSCNFFQDQIPVGKILTNLGAYVFDAKFSLIPFGLPGELFIEGVGLGRGYLNDPEKTALSFLPFPFSKEGKRMYKTGDIARYLPGGFLDYLGRADFQVKIRGQRIELGEIEAILSHHEKILQIVVEAKEFKAGEKQLVAFVAVKQSYQTESETNITSEIQSYALSKLPHHMVPMFFVILPSLPLLTNGKVNRKALVIPENRLQLVQKNASPPSTPTEMELMLLWQDILKISSFGIEDNFFHLGGHSLLATQVISSILQVFDIKLPLKIFFENPTIKGLAKQIDISISSKEKIEGAKFPLIVADKEHLYDEFPLTDVQQAYWLGRSGIFDLGEVSVHVYSEYDCENIDIERLEKAWNLVIQRHEALRLVLTPHGTQKILQETPYYSFEIFDLRDKTTDDLNEQLLKLRNSHSHEVFEATSWPLFSIKIAKLQNRIRLYLSFDALVLDGWSVDIVFTQWVHHYDHPDQPLPPLQLSFRDYVIASKNLNQVPLYQKDREYWLKRVVDFPLAPALPLIKTTKEIQEQKFSRCKSRFSKSKWKDLQTFLHTQSLTPTGLLSALFGEVLNFYSNSSHFAINLTLFDRLPLHPQVNEIAGDFTSLTLLEIDMRKPTAHFLERAKKVQKQLWDDLDHQLFSGIAFLREIAQKNSHLDSGSLFPVVFTSVLGLDNKQNEDVLRIFGNEVFSITQTPQVWLDFKAYEIDGDLVIEWDYVAELFAPHFVSDMHTSYMELLEELLNHSEAWKKSNLLSLLPKQLERRKNFNNTWWEREAKIDLLHELFNEKAQKQPHHPAVITPIATFNYDFIYRKSNQIGHQLRKNSIQPGQLVAVLMEKGWEQVASTLGILQSGGAYLPLDPSLPKERLEEILHLSKTAFLLTQIRFVSELKAFGLPILAIDDESSPYLCEPETHLPSINTPEDLAYVIYTSGSTGVPKGVTITHQAVVNTLLDINERFKISATDRVLALSNLNFDLSVFDIFGMLAAGGTIVFPEEHKIKDPDHWLDLLKAQQISIWNTVPMFMQMLTEFLEHKKELPLNNLRLVLLSGDWIPVELPAKIRTLLCSSLEVISLGGATEASIWSIIYPLSPSESFLNSIPYGFPLRNQQFYILNEQLEQSPEWVVGELYIGGVGLSNGYLNDPERTNASFFTHPTLGPLYRTGDLGRYLPQGVIEFLGRNDFQVKINGYRVEMQEIETILNQHEDIEQALVCSQNRLVDNKKLVGYVIPSIPPLNDNLNSVLTDPQEILAFKLAQKNRKKIEDPLTFFPLKSKSREEKEVFYFKRRSFRTFQGPPLETSTIHSWMRASLRHPSHFSQGKSPMTDEVLGEVLEAFSTYSHSEYPGYKYRYPSAGNLYPVQVYLRIPEQLISGIEGGYYYYDAIDHRLIKISLLDSDLQSQNIALYFVAKLDAITPLYGSYAQDFCSLEAGYMLELLRQECGKNNIPLTFLSNVETLEIPLQLEKDHRFLMGLEMNGSSSSLPNRFLPSICVYIKNEGWYFYNWEKEDLIFLKDTHPLQLSLASQDSYAIFHDSSFAIFFLENEHSLPIETLLQTGAISQRLMDLALSFGIGLCPIGALDERGNHVLHKISPGRLIHALFGGPVGESQISARSISQERKHVFQEVLSHYLEERLPKYMVPTAWVVMDQFPLSGNGKIDRQALLKMDEVKIKAERILPQSNWEHRLFKIWTQILNIKEDKISTTDTFFELGGNSLMLIQMHNQLQVAFHASIAIDKLFQYPTIQSLAHFLNQTTPMDVDRDAISRQAELQRLSRQNKRQKGRI